MRKPGKTEAPSEFAEKCRNRFHHRDTEDAELEGFLSVGEIPTDKKAQPCHVASLLAMTTFQGRSL